MPRKSGSSGHPQGPRELLKTPSGSRYIRRDKGGHFTKDQVNVGPSLAKDRQQHAKRIVRPGHGDQGDQKRR